MVMISISTLILALVVLTVYNLAFKVKERKGTTYLLLGCVLMVYLIVVLVEVVGFPSLHGLVGSSENGVPVFRPIINLTPFDRGVSLIDRLNLLMFIPLGFLLPTMWRNFGPFWKTLLFGLVFSLIIEFAQMFSSARVSDIDDLIMNTLGTIVGWLVFRVLLRKSAEERHAEKQCGFEQSLSKRQSLEHQSILPAKEADLAAVRHLPKLSYQSGEQRSNMTVSSRVLDWAMYPLIALVVSFWGLYGIL